MSPSAATEEYFLVQSLLRQLGSDNIDHRLREGDFSDDPARPLSPAFSLPLAEIGRCDAVLLIGSNPRQEAPIVGHRIRQAWRGGAGVSVINPLGWPFTFDTSLDAIVAPQQMVQELASLAAAVEKATGTAAPDHLRGLLGQVEVGERQQELAERLQGAGRSLCLLGQFAMAHPQAAALRALAAYVADATGSACNLLTHGGNSTGAWLAGAVPHRGPGGGSTAGGANAQQMLDTAHHAYLLWGIEPDYDCDNPAAAMQVLEQAETVIAVASFATDSLRQVADLILPLAPHAEGEGSFVNFDGMSQTFTAAGKIQGEARPGWKILRRLGSELDLSGFEQVSLADVQADLQRAVQGADRVGTTAAPASALAEPDTVAGLHRIGEVALYSVDPLCRRAGPLQETQQARSGFVGLNPADAERLGVAEGEPVRVSQGGQQAELKAEVSERVPAGGVWLRSATCATRMLGHAVAPVVVEKA
jgi:NADH-quinone oxidoreductase subunit G